MESTSLVEHRTQIANFGKDLLQICGIEFVQTTELQRQICGAFLFGVVFTHGKSNGLTPPDIQALAITMLKDVLEYSVEQAGAFSSRLIQATKAGQKDTMNSIIHRGIDGHRQLLAADHNRLRQNLLGVFQSLNATYVSK
jgi:hypothetical protein